MIMKKYLAIFLYIFNLNCFNLNPPIIVASLTGNYNRVVQEVNNGVSVNTRGVDNSTALMNAAAHGSGDIVVFLVENGANLSLTDNARQTAFDKAILNKQNDIAEFLTLKKDDPKFSKKAKQLTFIAAIRKNDIESLSEILNSGSIDVNQTNKWGNTPLKIALTHLNAKMIKLLVDHGADLEAKDKHGKTLLDNAIEQSHFPTINILVEAGAKVGEKKDTINKLEKESAQQEFFKAVYENDIQKVTQLLKTGLINIDERRYCGGKTSLETAVDQYNLYNTDMAKLLISYGADLDVKDSYGKTPLDCAIENKDISKIEVLVNLGANTQNRTDRINDLYKEKAQKEFFEALGQFNIEKITQLLETGLVDIEKPGFIYNSPRHYNSRRNYNVCYTALEYALSERNLDLVELLIEANASTKGKIEAINELRQTRARQESFKAQESLIEAIRLNDIQKITDILESGLIDLTKCESEALKQAIYNSSPETIKLLIDHGANLEAKDRDGQTPLDITLRLSRNPNIKTGIYLPIVEFLIELGADTQNRLDEINSLRQKVAKKNIIAKKVTTKKAKLSKKVATVKAKKSKPKKR